MRLSCSIRRLTYGLAALAMVVAALAPALAQALGPAAGVTWIEVCTAQGSRWVAADGTAPLQDRGAAMPVDDCAYCSSSAQPLGMAPAPVAAVVPACGDDAPGTVVRPAPRTMVAWLVAQPRAPPVRA
jgi:Protein of unknown function (DUF2946)